MFVEPTPVRPRPDRWVGLAVGLLALTFVVVAASVAAGGIAPSAQPSAVPTDAAIAPSAAPAVRRTVPAARTAELHGTIVPDGGGGEPQVAFWGWVPSQFIWAEVSIDVGLQRVSAPAIRVAAEGTFSGTADLGPANAALERVVVRLSGSNEVQLFAVPLVTIAVGGTAPRPAREQASSRSR